MQQDKVKIEVCFVMPKAYPLFNPAIDSLFGGAEVDLYYLSTELAKDDRFDVSFVVADYGQDAVETIEGVRVIKSVNFAQNPVIGVWKVWRALKKANADIYMLKTASPGVVLAKIFCAIHKRLFAYRAASSRECDETYIQDDRISGKFFAWSLQQADFVTVQNTEDGQNLYNTMSVRPQMIPNGHRLGDVDSAQRDHVLWVGRSADVKRPDLFLELARKNPDEKFVMICQHATGDNRYSSLVDEAAGIDNLEFHERVGFRQVGEYFARAKVLVNTSDSEGFPNIFIQACKAQVPILSLNVNPDGFLDEYGCGVCCGGDVNQMNEKLRTIISTDVGVEMGASGRRYVEQTHDIAKIIEQYKEIFAGLIDQEGGL